jgi:hypothetical protein
MRWLRTSPDKLAALVGTKSSVAGAVTMEKKSRVQG